MIALYGSRPCDAKGTVYSVYDYEGIPCVQKYLFTLKLKQHHAECVGAVYIVWKNDGSGSDTSHLSGMLWR